MKWFFALAFLFFFCVQNVSAHGSGFPPFFKIEGKIAEVYPLQNAGVYSSILDIPQDIAHRNFLVGENIQFEIDTERLETVFPSEVVEKIKYKWDFGDGSQFDGTKSNHQYKKIGSYILSITADYQDPAIPPQLIESVLIHVVPDKNYQLPKATIKINGQEGKSENYNILDFDLNHKLELDGSGSVSNSSRIKKFTWDFGDDKTTDGRVIKHQYQLPQAFATVVLRVEDENGFFADDYVNVRNNGKNDPSNLGAASFLKAKNIIVWFIIFVAIGFGILSFEKTKNK